MGARTHASRRACATVVAIAVLLAGCGDSSDSASPPAANSAQAAVEKKIASAQADANAAPTTPEPLAELAKAHFQAANLQSIPTGGYKDEGRKQLRLAALAWERYLALDPEPPDTGVAQLMAATYGPGGLDEPAKALRAQQILAENSEPPTAATYAQLARAAYRAGDDATGDDAAQRAVELAPKRDRARLRAEMRDLRAQLSP